MSARVTLTRRRMWSLRASLAAARWALIALALSGIAVSVRDLVRPRPAVAGHSAAALPADDAAARWLALRFARAYMAFGGAPAARERSLAPFVGSSADPDVGVTPAVRERVEWVEIAGEHDRGRERDFTVAVASAAGATRFLAVAIVDTGAGETLARYPALVAGPQPRAAVALDGAGSPTLDDPALATVVERALRNYLSGSTENLAADLATGAILIPAEPGLHLQAVQRLALESTGRLLATVLASDRAGDRLTLDYRVGARLLAGRWEITSIEP